MPRRPSSVAPVVVRALAPVVPAASPVAGLAGAALALAALVAPAPLAAQARAGRDTARDTARAALLDTVTVVAARRPTSIYAAPLAVTVLDRARLADRRGVGLDEALAQVPGVIALSRAGGTDVRLNVRGFGARGAGDRSNAGTTRGIRVLLDGFPETEPDGRTALDQLDLATAEGIEVIRSNASALWGNAAGGVVSVSTVPPADRARVSAQAMLGSYGLARQVVRASTPFALGALPGGVAWLAVTHTAFDGWRRHSDGARTLLVGGAATPVGARTRLGVFATATRNAFHVPGPLTRALAEADPAAANATYAARDERRDNRLGRLGVTLAHAPDTARALTASLFVNPKLLQRSERGTYRDFTRVHAGGSVLWSQGTRLAGRAGRLTVGADQAWQDGAVLFYSLSATNGRGPELRDDKREGARNLGLFVDQSVALGARLSVDAGARWDAIAYDYESHVGRRLADRRTFTRVTPKLAVNWRAGAARSLYAAVGGGVEAPAGNETDPASTFGQDTVHAINPLLDAIRSTTYELGTKQTLAVGSASLAYDGALYLTDVADEIVPYRGGRFYFTAGRVRRTGAELGVELRTPAGVTVRSALGASRNVYRRYRVDSVHYDPARAGRVADYAGNRAVGVPALVGDLRLGLEPALLGRVGARGVRLELGARGQSRYWADDANTVAVPGWVTASATLALVDGVPLGRRAALGGFVGVQNLLGRRYVESAFLNPDVVAGVPVAFEPGLPRNVVVALSVGRR